jgi:hypothetical protein
LGFLPDLKDQRGPVPDLKGRGREREKKRRLRQPFALFCKYHHKLDFKSVSLSFDCLTTLSRSSLAFMAAKLLGIEAIPKRSVRLKNLSPDYPSLTTGASLLKTKYCRHTILQDNTGGSNEHGYGSSSWVSYYYPTTRRDGFTSKGS